MTVQSIRAPVQVGHITRDHFFVPPRKMSFREMNGVGEFNYLAQEVWTRPETLDDPRNFLSSRTGSPEIVGRGRLAGGVGVLGNPDLGGGWLASD